MRTFWRFFIAFLAVTGAVALTTGIFGVEFGNSNYWDHHGLIFLGLITFFPRITLLFSSVVSGGLLWWLSWLFAPRLLVAVLATLTYWYQNPVLVVVAWLIAIGGESSEKFVVVQRTPWSSRGQNFGGKTKGSKWVEAEVE